MIERFNLTPSYRTVIFARGHKWHLQRTTTEGAWSCLCGRYPGIEPLLADDAWPPNTDSRTCKSCIDAAVTANIL